jgi:chemotaxis protein methyltransferase CheR
MSSDADLAWLRGFLTGRTGVVVPEDRPDFIASRLSTVLRAHRIESVSILVQEVRGGNIPLLAATVDALTTHETSFFRDPDVYAWLETEYFPALVNASRGKELSIWSAACSTGQEPLAVAMILLDRWPSQPFRIFASDISSGTLEKARSGTYSVLDMNRGLPARHLSRWFARAGLDYKAVPELQSKVHYQAHNLLDRGWPMAPVDAIFLRNVLIYFGATDRDTVFRNLAAVLRPGGIVVLGTAEALIEPPAGLFTRGRSARTTWLIRS